MAPSSFIVQGLESPEAILYIYIYVYIYIYIDIYEDIYRERDRDKLLEKKEMNPGLPNLPRYMNICFQKMPSAYKGME